MAQRSTERVVVFIDRQNLYKGAREDYRGMVDPSDYTTP
jgi:hypothetical protein